MVVPYGNSGSSDLGENSGAQSVSFDRPLKIFSVKEGSDRRERREKAMRHSEIAHQYRQAKKLGDQQALSSSKSLLNSFRQHHKSKKSLYHKVASIRQPNSQHSSSHDLPPISPHSHHSLVPKHRQDSEPGIVVPNHSDDMSDAHLEESEDGDHSEIEEIDGMIEISDDDEDSEIQEIEDDDEDDDESSSSSSSDDDFGVTGDDILQVDDTNFNTVFDDIITKKPADAEILEVAEWNHVMIGVELIGKLNCPPDLYNASLSLRCGKNENIVSRSYMEDRTYISTQQWIKAKHGNRLDVAIFGVFDGHNGEYVAQHLQDQYAPTFLTFLNQMEDKNELSLNDYINGNYEHLISQVFEQTNAKLDREILMRDFIRQQKSLKAGIKDISKFAGSVGVVAVVMPSRVPIKQLNSGNHTSRRSLSGIYSAQQVFISHVGDCRAVLSHDGQAVPLTEDHKPNVKSEKLRIEAAGGWVDKDRVTGALGVSRSFGDIEYKNFAQCLDYNGGDEHGPTGIWGEGQQVISKPDFKHFILERSYEFMILACDGLWDRFSCQEAVNFVRKKLLSVKDVNKVAQLLVEKAIARGTMDNTSVVIVTFHQ